MNSKATKIQEDYVNLLKERIIFSVNISASNTNATYFIFETFFYPFSQKWKFPMNKGQKFEKIRIKSITDLR